MIRSRCNQDGGVKVVGRGGSTNSRGAERKREKKGICPILPWQQLQRPKEIGKGGGLPIGGGDGGDAAGDADFQWQMG